VKSSERIIVMITEHPNITIPEMADKMQLSTRAVEKQIAKLKSKGVVHRVGSDKDGYWEIANDYSKE
jgi:ATP-dependent DNA helicase RecG